MITHKQQSFNQLIELIKISLTNPMGVCENNTRFTLGKEARFLTPIQERKMSSPSSYSYYSMS